jgi:hypothetical protein
VSQSNPPPPLPLCSVVGAGQERKGWSYGEELRSGF